MLDNVRHILNRFRRWKKLREQQALLSRLLPAKQLREARNANREALLKIPRWIDAATIESSIFNYGVPDDLQPLLDLEQGNETTYADAMACLSKRLTSKANYLEIGVSVGKTIWQMLHALNNGCVTGFDIEDLSPTLAKLATITSTERWPSMPGSLRKNDSTDQSLTIDGCPSTLRYIAADVFDEKAWARLKNQKFNLIFSDALHSKDAMLYEYEMIYRYKLLNETEFIFMWDDLNGEMSNAFWEIGSRLKRDYNTPAATQFIAPLRGWVGVHETPHNVGFVLNLRSA